jgi:hypothetical protein
MAGRRALFVAVCLAATTLAHDHHHGGASKIQDDETVSKDPIDAILWAHIFIQITAFGVIFPLGMVFGMSKSRWHVPTQALGSALAAAGYALGHLHHGREFAEYNAHSLFAPILNLSLIAQVLMGVYLKLHLERGVHGRIRRVVRPVHSLLGKGMPVVAWTQMVLGGITALGFCHGDYLGQCLAHFIMGSAFVAYGILMTVLLVVGQLWLRRTNRSQEFFDSVVIAAWGCVNTFTEHRWGTAWVKNDWQHTAMGIFWWAAGLVGVWLSRDRDGHPQRNFIPAFVIFITGWGMSAHPQELMVSAEVHKMFGYTLMAGGVARLVEIVFVLKDKAGTSEDGRGISSWQYVPIFLIFAAGFLFMGASHEQMDLVAASAMDHVSYILILFSVSALMFLLVLVLISTYEHLVPAAPQKQAGLEAAQGGVPVRDAQEFELEGLITDDEDDDDGTHGMLKGGGKRLDDDNDDSPSSPSTVGGNCEPLAK